MPDSRFTGAEYDRQRSLMKKRPYISSLLLFSLVLVGASLLDTRSAELDWGKSPVEICFVPVAVGPAEPERWSIAGAWRMDSMDPRAAGFSSLDQVSGRIVAATDSAHLVTIDAPLNGGGCRLADTTWLQRADGRPLGYNDVEAIVHTDNMVWAAREVRHGLLQYSRDLGLPIAIFDIEEKWPTNGGVEAMIAPHGDQPLLLLAERRRTAVAFDEGRFEPVSVEGVMGWPTDAARLADGRIVILSRTIRPWGFGAWIALAKYEEGAVTVGRAIRLPLSFRDNAEGITAAPLPGGATRLWIITDDNGNRYLRTLLVAIDIEADAWPDAP